MCVCVSVCIYAYMYEHICAFILCVHIYVCAYKHKYCVSILCAYVYINMCEYVHIYKQNVYFVCAYMYILIIYTIYNKHIYSIYSIHIYSIYTNKTEGLMSVWIGTRTSSTLFFAFFSALCRDLQGNNRTAFNNSSGERRIQEGTSYDKDIKTHNKQISFLLKKTQSLSFSFCLEDF